MNILAKTVAAASLALLAACGGGGSGDLRSDMIATMTDLVEVFEGIETKEDAEAAAGELEGIIEEMNALKEKFEALPEEEREAMEAEDEETKALGERMMKAMMSVMGNPEIAEVITPVMEKMPN